MASFSFLASLYEKRVRLSMQEKAMDEVNELSVEMKKTIPREK